MGEFLVKNAALRLTVAVFHEPNRVDAHGEYVEARELSRATLDYATKSDLKLRKMHDRSKVIGDVAAVICWPAKVAAELCVPTASCTRKDLNAGTTFLVTHWSPEAWADVKAGRLRGYSLGGRAQRVRPQKSAAGGPLRGIIRAAINRVP